MIKKTLFAVSASAALFLIAGQALAVSYAPTSGSSVMMNGQAGTQTITAPANMGAPVMMSPNYQYKMMAAQPMGTSMAGVYASRAAVWFSLMSVITIVLVWIVLIQLIFVLFHWLKKHKH